MDTRVQNEFGMWLARRWIPLRYWSTSSRNGSEWKRLWVWRVLGVRLGFFERITEQKWTPLMSEMERTRGVIIGRRQIGSSVRKRVWHDAQEPRWQRID